MKEEEAAVVEDVIVVHDVIVVKKVVVVADCVTFPGTRVKEDAEEWKYKGMAKDESHEVDDDEKRCREMESDERR